MIKQSVINTFNRVHIPYTGLDNTVKDVEVCNRFGGGCVKTTELIAFLVKWIYYVSDRYELGCCRIKISDFDRIRYFVAEQDSNVYSTCID